MTVAVTGDIWRPGQEGNIAWLWSLLRAAGLNATYLVAPPLDWSSWLYRQWHGVEEYKAFFRQFELIIGFELPPAAKRSGVSWIDIRRHPYRFYLPYWSVESALTLSLKTEHVPRPRSSEVKSNAGAFMCQVSSDAALLREDRLVTVDDFLSEIREFAARFPEFWIVPHPFEWPSPWVERLLVEIPHARVSQEPAYTLMGRIKAMMTVSSSTGYEAPLFGCEAHVLMPRYFSQPVDITTLSNWLGA